MIDPIVSKVLRAYFKKAFDERDLHMVGCLLANDPFGMMLMTCTIDFLLNLRNLGFYRSRSIFLLQHSGLDSLTQLDVTTAQGSLRELQHLRVERIVQI
jgi:hypothetical protein